MTSTLESPVESASTALQDELSNIKADVDALARTFETMRGVNDRQVAADRALQAVLNAYRYPHATIYLLGDDGDLHFRNEIGSLPAFGQASKDVVYKVGQGLTGKAIAAGKLQFVSDLSTLTDDPRAAVYRAAGLQSGFAIPLIIDGRPFATVEAFHTESRHPSESRLATLEEIGRIVSDTLANVYTNEAVREQAAETVRRVESLLNVVRAAADGDLTQTITDHTDDNVGHMGDALSEFLAALRVSITDIASTATTLASAAAELTAVAKSLDEGALDTSDRASNASSAAVEISSSIQTVASASEEMTASIREIAKNATDGAAVATQAVKVASGAQATVASLGEASAEIGQVIKVITSIAQQTNLLALNATIEAARAGEAGKGFAVVANEVKELAKETATATEEISQKIDAIQGSTGEAVSAISQITDVIGTINDITGTIASAVEEQTATTNEIARSVTEAASGANQIAEDVTRVATAASDSRTSAESTLQAADELTRMAVTLQELVDRFQV